MTTITSQLSGTVGSFPALGGTTMETRAPGSYLSPVATNATMLCHTLNPLPAPNTIALDMSKTHTATGCVLLWWYLLVLF